MKDEHMLMYFLVFVLGFLVARMMKGRLVEGEGEGEGEGIFLSSCRTLQDCGIGLNCINGVCMGQRY